MNNKGAILLRHEKYLFLHNLGRNKNRADELQDAKEHHS